MIVYSLAGITIVLALLCLFALWRCCTKGSWLIVRVLFAVSFACFLYLYGCWVFVSVYLKYAFALGALLVLIGGYTRRNKRPLKTGPAYPQLFSGLFFAYLSVLYFTGTTGVPETVELTFPFKSGRYLVFQGGKGLPTNLFHYGLRGAIYAMDLVKLDNAGNRASHVFSTTLTDYHIFGDTIYSPCSGRVVKARADNPDNIPPDRDRGPSNTNQVLIDAGVYYVFMGHMKRNSVLVHEGDSVVAGQPLGQVGNSGFSLEPHLHIQVHAKTNGERWYQGRPLYIRFNGRSYLLFQEIDTKE